MKYQQFVKNLFKKGLVLNGVQMLMSIALPPLPYEYNALEPHISEQTLRFHHDKHLAKYVDTTNQLISRPHLQDASLLDIMKDAHDQVAKGYKKSQKLYNNAAQVWNHDFYFKCLKKGGGGEPSGQLLNQINKHFGPFVYFREQFEAACNNQFGSGYGWLVLNSSGALEIRSTFDAENPLTQDGAVPLLCIDVWEHAYYLDQQNLRNKYVSMVMEHLVNWEFVEQQLAHALAARK